MIILWFRQDLRILDNPALYHAVEKGDVLPVYILDDENAGDHKMGAASRWWLHHSLASLDKSLKGKLNFYKGSADRILADLVQHNKVKGVFWNRCYEPWRIRRDKDIKIALQNQDIEVKSYNASLLWEPWDVLKKDKTPYRVFTPFFKKGCLEASEPRKPYNSIREIEFVKMEHSLDLCDLALLSKRSWEFKLESHWRIGEEGALDSLNAFLNHGIQNYKKGRDFPAMKSVSRLSPHLHFGEISPHMIWHQIQKLEVSNDRDHFMSELGWREFSYHLLFHFPSLPSENFQQKFDHFPWQKDEDLLKIWQKGNTGIPLVDAGMRELWQTGYMHNRIRMVVASFLIKNLLIDWREGERWFWDCLVDADLASNSASWQWVAGSGVDAAPYFRVFNPAIQAKKFDPDGEYIKKFIPELRNVPSKFIGNPWEAPIDVLKEAGVELGKTYPKPIVDLKKTRENALEAYKKL